MRRDIYRGVRLPEFRRGYDEGPAPSEEATVILGLGFGDECKGMAVAHETGRAVAGGYDALNVRFNGGAQAAHNVIVERTDGRRVHHTHSQFGSGTLLGARTLLTGGMLVSPISLIAEAERLMDVTGDADIPSRLTIEATAPALLPFHGKANQIMEERRGSARHGSTGLGIGVARTCEATAKEIGAGIDLLLTVGDLLDEKVAIEKMTFWVGWVEHRFGIDLGMGGHAVHDDVRWASECLHQMMEWGTRVMDADAVTEELGERLDDSWTSVIFEGSQGVLLDERHGWFPHVTYGDMTAKGAHERIGDRRSRVLGITRCYQTRHGAGPFPTEGTYDVSERFNVTGPWAGGFRTGLLDLPTLARVTRDVPVDALAVSCLDKYPGRCAVAWGGEADYAGCDRRRVPTDPIVATLDEAELLATMGDVCGGVPVAIAGRGDVTVAWEDVVA